METERKVARRAKTRERGAQSLNKNGLGPRGDPVAEGNRDTTESEECPKNEGKGRTGRKRRGRKTKDSR